MLDLFEEAARCELAIVTQLVLAVCTTPAAIPTRWSVSMTS